MGLASKDYIIHTIFKTNILPIITECNTSCVFCSHRQNPEGIEVFKLPKLGVEDFEELIGYLSPDSKIVIGESATRIMEGEPLLHKDFAEILGMVRDRNRNTPIQVTTNGILLSENLVEYMHQLGNIELNVSVNSIHIEKRQRLLGLGKPGDIRDNIRLLAGRLKFSGSCVMVPDLVEEEDLIEMIAFLEENGADSVRLFLPGYTSKAAIDVDFMQLFAKAQRLLEMLRKSFKIPIILEPFVIKDLDCVVEGVVMGSPAFKAGLLCRDILLAVNGKAVVTRVDAFNEAFRRANPSLKVKRGEDILEIVLEKRKNSPPGFIVLYDIDPGLVKEIQAAVARHKGKDILIMVSELAAGIFEKLLEKEILDFNYRIIRVRNRFFGGTIKCAGLLTVEDILKEAGEYMGAHGRPDLILLPPLMFDYRNTDLTGRSMQEIENNLGIPVEAV